MTSSSTPATIFSATDSPAASGVTWSTQQRVESPSSVSTRAGYSVRSLPSPGTSLTSKPSTSPTLFSGSIPDSLSNLTRLTRLGPLRKLLLWLHTRIHRITLQPRGALPRQQQSPRRNPTEFESAGELETTRAPREPTQRRVSRVGNNAISGKSINPPELSAPNLHEKQQLARNSPGNIKHLGFLQVLDLSHNQLGGFVPSYLFEHPSLQQLTLSFNQLSSVRPPISLGTQSEMIALDLSNNQLKGPLPSFLPMMPKLSALTLENNKFMGMIPTQYAFKVAVPGSGVSAFERRLLGGNYLFGPIPGPLLGLKPGSANVGLADNCLYRCPRVFFFCQVVTRNRFLSAEASAQ
ncbi:hypothetical protein GBA52_023308 [Prunus armeniaca]|nr:hypothetical protein GBA52_023308 [Prunus armeniaca]